MLRWLCVCCVLAIVSPAFAQEHEDRQYVRPGVLAGGLAVVPGFVVHGAGAFTIGDRRAARRLLITEAIGLGALIGGGTLLAVTGTSRRMIGVVAPITIAGFGLFMLSWLADIYAATTGGRDAHAPGFSPRYDAELGYAYVHDPQFRYGSFATLHADLRAHDLRLSPDAWIALDDDNQRFTLELAYRPFGRTPRRAAPDGSYAELATAFRHHRFGSDDFAVITPMWWIQARLDLARVAPTLAGAFVEGQLGAGLELYDFDVRGSKLGDNAFGLLLSRFGFGAYFGDGGARSGELFAYYDHRHDDFAAGLGVQGIGSGILGHVGARGHYFITRNWGVSGLVELGSALVTSLAVRYRGGM
ncbi:MAG TPA: hypothetical protein VFX59_22440 [Polyangiales bacterium]|nr:hypothetical protein [Polyangiales bacterium]